ncbi:MAG: HAMP domain-containing protein [Lachnospiraceae bacterium]|nr:HAMP domain-containing protein [Lachnospiraceae bacterium]
MNRIKKIYTSFSARVTLLMCIIMIVFSAVWSIAIVSNMRTAAINNIISEEEAFISNTKNNTKNVKEVCNLALRVVSSLDSLNNYLNLVKSGKDLSPKEKIEFYNNNILSISNITNLNPYLYQIRIYATSDNISENAPTLYNIDRMYNFSWAKSRVDGTWIFDYNDTVFDENNKKRLFGITDSITDHNNNTIAIIEVAAEIESLFPDMFSSQKNSWACFIENTGKIHYDKKSRYVPNQKEKLVKIVNSKTKGDWVDTIILDEEEYVISSTYIDSFNGSYIHISKITSFVNSYFQSQQNYILIIICSVILSVIVMTLVTTHMFKRFNYITESIQNITHGQTDLRISVKGNDEISDMATHFNQMLDNLELLNKENTNRQLIAKNTEIKSMQNQINAHFMYNVLESIKMMAEIKGEYDISDAVTSLGEMFRYSVKWTSGKATLGEEIKYIKNYLSLMNLRSDHEIVLSLNVPKDLLNYRIPKMSLQPIVENSVHHGIENSEMDASIYLKVFVEDNNLQIEISDNGNGMDEKELLTIKEKLKDKIDVDEAKVHGLALKNVQNRIKLFYGENYGLEIYSRKGLYTKVVIILPYIENEGDNNE